MTTVIGEAAGTPMLRTLSPTEQHGVALGFIMKEQREIAARATVSTPSTPRVELLKLHVNSYVGREGESLLRWLVEVDTAITARGIVDRRCLRLRSPCHVVADEQGVERLDAWTHGSYVLSHHDVHAYAQRARYLVSNIVINPIDEATKVVTFMKGLRDGLVNTYLFREYPNTLEAAITLAMQEGFSLRQAKLHANVPRPMPRQAMKPTGGPEPMHRSSATSAGPQQRRESTNVRFSIVEKTWPLPPDQVKAIDDYFESRRKAGQVRESKSLHGSPTVCVKKAQGGWRIVHAYHKLNDATVPAQRPIPRKGVNIDSMALSTIFSALDLRDGFYQILMRESDIPLMAVSTPSGMLWEWLVMPQGLKNASATFNRCVTHSVRDAPVKQSLTEAPILAVADHDRPFHVVCDASDFAIGCALMQHDHEGRDRVVYYQSRQLKPAERNYPVHGKELLAMKYALAKFRVYLLGGRPFVVYTDHASLRTAIKSPHISQRMARWLSVFAEYNFQVKYKPGSLNVVHKADANCIGVQLLNYFAAPSDKSRQKLAKHRRARVHRYRVHNGLLLHSAVDDNADRVVVLDDHELKLRIIYEYQDAPTSGHPGREKTYLLLTRVYWCHQYKWVRKYVRACEVCQRVKPAPFSQAPLQSLPTPSECWQSISMDFVLGRPPDSKRRTGIVVFVDLFSKMVHLAAVPAEVTAKQTARLFVVMVFRHYGMPIDIVSDRDPRFTARFWQEMFTLLGTQLSMSTADHPQTDGQIERVNGVLVDALKSYTHSFHHWSDCLPMAEFAINNSVHVSTGNTPFYVNALRHPRVPSVLGTVAPSLSVGGYPVLPKLNEHADMTNISAVSTRARSARRSVNDSTVSTPGVDTLNNNEQHPQAGPVVNKDAELNSEFSSKAMDFVQRRQAVIRFVQDAIAASVERQKLNADNNGI
ncbi:unnamed protein product [Phytophthora fragariaefolia]|uniref:Unnamed protein product n=1 Tax=Phytophthora fragariaefolia TaxID=1490495 RepID=A0A9W6X195_9STRA|nr:unnamed protein product [Phytophthora fragariaefolia]